MKFAFFDLEVGCSEELCNLLVSQKIAMANAADPHLIPRLDIWEHWPFSISVAATKLSDVSGTIAWYDLDKTGAPVPRWGTDFTWRFVNILQRYQEDGYTLCGWNSTGFDFRLLGALTYRVWAIDAALDSIDPNFQSLCMRGYPVALNGAAHFHGLGKTEESGANVPLLWLLGEYDRCITYVVNDVDMLASVVSDIQVSRGLRWIANSGIANYLYMPTLLNVRHCLKLPLPDTSWMDNAITREETIQWMAS